MKILIYYQYFGTPKGKWSTRVYEFTKRWVDAGHKVTVITAPYEKSDITAAKWIERQTVEGVDLVVINFPDSNRYGKVKRIFYFMMFSLLSIWYGLTQKYDVAIASSGPITIGLPAIIAKWIRRKPYIFEVRDLWPQGAVSLNILKGKMAVKLAFWFEKLCYKNAYMVVGCSPGMSNDIKKRFPLVKTDVISNACDIKLFSASSIKPINGNRINRFIYAGSLGVMDDVESVVEAAIELERRGYNNVAIEIIGDGVERNKLEQKAKSHHLKNVEFLGLLPKMEVVHKLKNAKAAFVCFKNIEVLNTVSPNKMFDAFAAGVPIIQNTTGWIKDYLDIMDCGISVEPGSTSGLAEAIISLSDDSSLRDRLARNAFEAAQTDFNRDTLALKYESLIKTAVENG